MALVIDSADEARSAIAITGYIDAFQFMSLVVNAQFNPKFIKDLTNYDADSLERLVKKIREAQKDA